MSNRLATEARSFADMVCVMLAAMVIFMGLWGLLLLAAKFMGIAVIVIGVMLAARGFYLLFWRVS